MNPDESTNVSLAQRSYLAVRTVRRAYNHNLIGGWPHRDFGIVVFSSEVHCADRSLSLSRTSGKFGEIEGERLVVALPLANV